MGTLEFYCVTTQTCMFGSFYPSVRTCVCVHLPCVSVGVGYLRVCVCVFFRGACEISLEQLVRFYGSHPRQRQNNQFRRGARARVCVLTMPMRNMRTSLPPCSHTQARRCRLCPRFMGFMGNSLCLTKCAGLCCVCNRLQKTERIF